MALHLEVKAPNNQDADAATTTAATAASDRSGKNATPAANHGDDGQPMTKTAAVIADDVDKDELFELDIALLDGRGSDGHRHHRRHRSHSAAAAAGHALLANCLLPVQSVSSAVPVPASSSVLSLYHPYSGYYSSRSLIFTGGGDSRRFLGRSAGSSARLCFSSRGFDTMGSYFQRY